MWQLTELNYLFYTKSAGDIPHTMPCLAVARIEQIECEHYLKNIFLKVCGSFIKILMFYNLKL